MCIVTNISKCDIALTSGERRSKYRRSGLIQQPIAGQPLQVARSAVEPCRIVRFAIRIVSLGDSPIMVYQDYSAPKTPCLKSDLFWSDSLVIVFLG
jgi:hypothetical protein